MICSFVEALKVLVNFRLTDNRLASLTAYDHGCTRQLNTIDRSPMGLNIALLLCYEILDRVVSLAIISVMPFPLITP